MGPRNRADGVRIFPERWPGYGVDAFAIRRSTALRDGVGGGRG
jgi:hypothetical protein